MLVSCWFSLQFDLPLRISGPDIVYFPLFGDIHADIHADADADAPAALCDDGLGPQKYPILLCRCVPLMRVVRGEAGPGKGRPGRTRYKHSDGGGAAGVLPFPIGCQFSEHQPPGS